jgi:hypothetical protein
MNTEEIATLALLARKYSQFLYINNFIDKETNAKIEESIVKLQRNRFIFITKPFHRCDSVGQTLFCLMKALQKDIHKLTELKE